MDNISNIIMKGIIPWIMIAFAVPLSMQACGGKESRDGDVEADEAADPAAEDMTEAEDLPSEPADLIEEDPGLDPAHEDAGDADVPADVEDEEEIPAPPPPPWPEWAFHHWVWEDESTQESALALVNGYLDRDIPVGAIIIDSPWETGYNTCLNAQWDHRWGRVGGNVVCRRAVLGRF